MGAEPFLEISPDRQSHASN